VNSVPKPPTLSVAARRDIAPNVWQSVMGFSQVLTALYSCSLSSSILAREPTDGTRSWRSATAECVGVYECGHASNDRGDAANRIESARNGQARLLPLVDHSDSG
jgi:hypothetical protein